jgi:ligand-binding sensor domain-containing protein
LKPMSAGKFFTSKIWALSAIFLYCSLKLNAQSFSLKHYTVEDGLNTSTVYYATQDLQGNMWFATEQGVCKFDGRTFTRYTINDGLSDNEVLFIKTDTKGRIWFLTLNGHISLYYNGRFYNEFNAAWLKKAFIGRSYSSCFEDSQGRIFFGGYTSSITVIKNDSSVSVIPIKSYSSGNSFFQNPDGSVSIYIAGPESYTYNQDKLYPLKLAYQCTRANCISYTNRYQIYMSNNGLIKRYGNHEEILIPSGELHPNLYVTSATEKSDSSILITGRNGVLWFPKNVLKKSEAIKMLAGKKVLSHYTDRENNFWFCTEGDGIYMLADNQKKVFSFTVSNGLHSEAINRVIKDNQQKVWVACDNSAVAEIADDSITNFIINDFVIKNERTRDVIIDAFGNTLAAGDGGIIWIRKTGQQQYIHTMWEWGLGKATVKSIVMNSDSSITATITDGVIKLVYDKNNHPKYFSRNFWE